MASIRKYLTPVCAGAVLVAGFFAFLAAPAVAKSEVSAAARELVEHADRANSPLFLVETMKMVLTEGGGKRFERRLRLWTEHRKAGDRELMRFLSPDEIRGTGLLTLEHRGSEDDQWFYLPATRRIRRIAGADRRNRFLGTEFLYEDLQGYHPENYTFRMLSERTINGEVCHVIEARPRRPALSAYSRKVLYLGRKTLVLRRVEMYDQNGKELKVITASGVKEVLPGIFLPDHVLAKNLENGRSTSLDTLDRQLPKALPADTFTQRNLRRRLRPDER